MPIYRHKPSGCWMFEFSRRIDGQRIRKRQLLPAGWTRAQADAYERAQSASLYAVASGISKPRHTIDEAVSRYTKERLPCLKHGANVERELDGMRDWWSDRNIEELPKVCAEYTEDQTGALAPATIKNRIAYLRAACRYAWKRHNMAESNPGARVQSPTVRNVRPNGLQRRGNMGYMRHDAIVVTSWKNEAIKAAAAKARECGLEVLGPSGVATNGIRTLLVCPDGSKEGWEESDSFDAKRAAFIAYLNGERYEDNSSCLSWVALAYGSDDAAAEITAHTWQVPVRDE